jgi:hypothetical protein
LMKMGPSRWSAAGTNAVHAQAKSMIKTISGTVLHRDRAKIALEAM